MSDGRRLLIATTVPETLRVFMLPLTRHLRAHGWHVDAMAAGASEMEEVVSTFGRVWDVPISRRMLDPRNLLVAPRKIRRAMQEGGYDIVHVHTPIAAFVVRFALRNVRRHHRRPRVVYTAHGFHFFQGAPFLRFWLFLALEKLAARWTDYLILVNDEDAESAERYDLLPSSNRYRTRGVGIDLSRFDPARVTPEQKRRFRQELGMAADAPLFVSVAEFIARKRHADVLRAFARLDVPDAHLALAGIGPLLESSRRLAAELGVADRVHFLGYRKDIPVVNAAADALVLASTQEGLPTCVLEAQTLGIPVIGSDIRGTRDLLGGERGYLFPLGDVEALRDRMNEVLANRKDAVARARRGQAEAKERDVESVNHVYETLYERALADDPWTRISHR